MTLAELKRLVAKGESNHLEFKRTTGTRNEAAKTVCAMLNGLGGYVIFGVGDKKELLEQDIGQRSVEEVTNELARIEPPAFPEVETVAFKDGRFFIVLRVSGGGGLFNHDGRYYVRVHTNIPTVGKQKGDTEWNIDIFQKMIDVTIHASLCSFTAEPPDEQWLPVYEGRFCKVICVSGFFVLVFVC